MSFLLLGARGTGKTWLLEADFRDRAILWINLLKNKEFLTYQVDPARIGREIEHALAERTAATEAAPPWVIVDEVQRVPALLNEIHALIEDRALRNRVRFGLSGSSARKLKRGGANLLAGRALLNQLYPLTADELGGNFDLDETLSWGALPAVRAQPNRLVRAEILETYVAVYLREEIREEQIVRNLDPFTRFLEVAAQSSGQIINYSKIGHDCNVDSRAVARYFQILEESLLGTFIGPYHASVRKQQTRKPKFYFFDLGVMRALERTLDSPIRPGSYGYGRLFEHFVVWEIIKKNSYCRKRYKLSYLSTKDGAEIDLVVERSDGPNVLMEIKSSTEPRLEDARHVMRLRTAFPNSQSWLVSRIERERIESDVHFLNWRTALQKLFD